MSLILHAQPPQRGPYPARPDSRRPLHDFYPTPPEATRALLSAESFEGSIWECACGDGAIATVLKRAGHEVIGTDLIYRGYGAGGVDFLEQREPVGANIITNPPYGSGMADRFAKHALALTARTGGSVAMLMNLASLCHPSRHDWYVSHPPATIYALDELVCWPHGEPKFATSKAAFHRYCWMVWRPDHSGGTTFGWLSTRSFRDAGGHKRQNPN